MTDEQEKSLLVESTTKDPIAIKHIKELKGLAITVGLIAIVIMLFATLCIGILIHTNQQAQTTTIFVTPTPTPLPVVTTTSSPTPVPTPELPSTITFTVLQANQAQYNAINPIDREYTLYTTDGKILVLPDYYQWNVLYPDYVYTCAVIGTQPGYGLIYKVNSCNAFPYQKPITVLQPYTYYNGYSDYNLHNSYYDEYDYTYYHYNNRYFRCDRNGNTCSYIDTSHLPAYVTIRESLPPGHAYTH